MNTHLTLTLNFLLPMQDLSGTVYATHAMPPVQYKAWSPTSTTTVVTPGTQRAFRLPDPRQMPPFNAVGLEEVSHGGT